MIWLKYCRRGVKQQSINQSFDGLTLILVVSYLEP